MQGEERENKGGKGRGISPPPNIKTKLRLWSAAEKQMKCTITNMPAAWNYRNPVLKSL
jgi:hypothetical protein